MGKKVVGKNFLLKNNFKSGLSSWMIFMYWGYWQKKRGGESIWSNLSNIEYPTIIGTLPDAEGECDKYHTKVCLWAKGYGNLEEGKTKSPVWRNRREE